MREWTKEQRDAFEVRGRNILVSAAAGSGKTSVLVQRVIELIGDDASGCDIDRLLIVTFTNAAAAEMKHRLVEALNNKIKNDPDNLHLRKQLTLIDFAKISTIDSFCIDLVRENFYELGINQDFTPLEGSEYELMIDAVIDEAITEGFMQENKGFRMLIEAFTTPNSDQKLINIIKSILQYIYAQPFPYLWLDKMIEHYNASVEFDKTIWFDYIKEELYYLIDYCNLLLDNSYNSLISCYSDKVSEVLNSDKSIINSYSLESEGDWNKIFNSGSIKFNTLRFPKDYDEQCKDIIKSNRSIYKDIITKRIPSLFASDSSDYYKDTKELYVLLRALFDLVKEVDSRLKALKDERNAYTFSDIEHYAISILFKEEDGVVCSTPLADSLRNNFYEILVDEYQDTNEAQDMLFTYLSNGKNLFVVGDIKQSIYRFRLAMPSIFNEKRKSYALYDENDNSNSSKIILDRNFRSNRGVCSYVNFVFSNIMSEKVGEITYDKSEYLNFNENSDNFDTGAPSAQIRIINNASGELKDYSEGLLIASMIRQRVESHEKICVNGRERNIRYGDFAILMRSTKNHISDYIKALNEYGISAITENSSNIFESNEIKIIISLLRAINNPSFEIPLIATMTSAIYGFTDDELVEIREANPKGSFYSAVLKSDSNKVKNFLDDLNELRSISVAMSVSGFIRYLIEEKSIISLANAYGNGESRFQNILGLISFAETFDGGTSVGLTAFLRYADSIINSGKEIPAAQVNKGSSDSVSIMTIHKSKGLEFPFVILAGASRRYNYESLNDPLLLNTTLGIGVGRYDDELQCTYKTIPQSVIRSKNKYELMSENLRVLYVAITRAREQFITFISEADIAKRLTSLSSYICDDYIHPECIYSITKDSDLILLTALLHKGSRELREKLGIWSIREKQTDFDLLIKIDEGVDVLDSEERLPGNNFDNNIIRQISERLRFRNERLPLSSLSSKATASSLDSSDRGYEYIAASRPAFMSKSGLTPAQRGTAMHSFMQYCSYEASRSDLEAEISLLCECGHLTDEEASSLDRKALSSFFNSDFASRMFNSVKIYREIKALSYVKACDIYDTDFEDKVLIQGIADCVFEEDDGLVLVDYKTDRVSDENELLNRYRKQISFYRESVGRVLGKPVKEAYLYSFALNKICQYK